MNNYSLKSQVSTLDFKVESLDKEINKLFYELTTQKLKVNNPEDNYIDFFDEGTGRVMERNVYEIRGNKVITNGASGEEYTPDRENEFEFSSIVSIKAKVQLLNNLEIVE